MKFLFWKARQECLRKYLSWKSSFLNFDMEKQVSVIGLWWKSVLYMLRQCFWGTCTHFTAFGVWLWFEVNSCHLTSFLAVELGEACDSGWAGVMAQNVNEYFNSSRNKLEEICITASVTDSKVVSLPRVFSLLNALLWSGQEREVLRYWARKTWDFWT